MNVVRKTDTFLSADGKTNIACYFYEPENGATAGVVQISHGMCEYVDRYEDFIAYLCENGFAVCGNDHLGHGHTASRPEDLGYFAEKEGDAFLPKDLHQMTQLARKRYPGLPLILFGHSMGSLIARRYLVDYGRELEGVILCGTSGSQPAAGLGVWLAKRIGSVRGLHHRSKLLDRLSIGNFNSRFRPEKGNNLWLSRDQAQVARYSRNPLTNYRFTTGGFRDMFHLVQTVSGRQWAEKVPKDLPVLLISGAMDPVGNFGKGVREVERLLREAGVRDLTCRLFEEDRHEILFELDREEVFRYILDWCRRICGKSDRK
ncbi:MAG: alpha/beta fold hydrolase [Candidatus Merdivicinus sp.]|jgi:alpha-beta hydrolase superfamily lysophospholipase